MKFLKKLTAKEIGLDSRDLEKIAIERKKETSVMRVHGRVRTLEYKDSQYGPYVLYSGEFEAMNLANGEKYRSGKLILPPIAETALQSTCSKKAPEDLVEFALEVTVAENVSTKGGWKFKYGVKSLKDLKEQDALTEIADQLPEPKLLENQTTKKSK